MEGAVSIPDYFDLDSILAEEERVAVTFKVGCTGLGRALDPSCDDDDLKEESNVELPFWVVKDLAARGFVGITRPKYYDHRVRNDLEADSRCVNLIEKCAYYYEMGLNVLSITNDKYLSKMLKTTFGLRYEHLLIKAMSLQPDTDDLSRTERVLSREERNVFEAGRSARKVLTEWHVNLPPKPCRGNKRKGAAVDGQRAAQR